MFKELFSRPRTERHLVIARLNDRCQPMDRGERYEDPLDAFLKANGLGEVSGGGTSLMETGEIEYCDIELQLSNVEPEVLDAVAAHLNAAGAPKGSNLRPRSICTAPPTKRCTAPSPASLAATRCASERE